MYKFKFADIGEGLHEGKVGEIYKQVGDLVKEGDSLFSVETDKVTSDIPSPVDGKITKVLIEQGATVHVGDDVFYFQTDQDNEAPADEPAPAEKASEETAASAGASVVGEVKVSNELFSFDSFKKPQSQPNTAKIAVTTSQTTESRNVTQSFNIDAINPQGNGEKVDVVVIGAGPGGYKVAEHLAKSGFKTVVIEKTKAGGVCLNIGCIPTKALLKSSKLIHDIKVNAADYGINVDYKNVAINWQKIQERKQNIVNKLTSGVEMLLKFSKAELIYGEAHVIDRYNVKVNDRQFTTKVIILATGSSPIKIPAPGFDSADAKDIIIDSTGALSLKQIPKTLTVVGGGVIGIEFAMLYNELGTKVTILEGADSILGNMDGQIKQFTHKMLIDNGIDVYTKAFVKGFENKKIVYEHEGKKHTIAGEKVLVSVGRKANNLNLDQKLGLKLGSRGEFIVNDKLQTSIDNIFAIGDANAEVMLAHVAYKHAMVVHSVLTNNFHAYDIKKSPACVYTHPEISSVGLTEEEAKKQGRDYLISTWQNTNVGRSLIEGIVPKGFAKLIIDKISGEIIGAHIINNNSSEMIAEIGVLMELEGTVYELAETVHPHPSISEAIYEAAEAAVVKLRKIKNK